MRTVDLNADLGERAGPCDTDDLVMAWVTSANVACGGHAGDEASMERTVRSALARGVAVGAHPSYPDRDGFGRRRLSIGAAALEEAVAAQVARLAAVAARLGATLRHVKPHGALYNAAASDAETARAVARGVARAGGSLVLVGLAGSRALEVYAAEGFATAAEAFADRLYEPDGSLTPRSVPGAVVTDPAVAAARAVAIARDGVVLARDGSRLALRADTLCLHGDGPGAAELAAAVATALRAAGVVLAPLGPATGR